MLRWAAKNYWSEIFDATWCYGESQKWLKLGDIGLCGSLSIPCAGLDLLRLQVLDPAAMRISEEDLRPSSSL